MQKQAPTGSNCVMMLTMANPLNAQVCLRISCNNQGKLESNLKFCMMRMCLRLSDKAQVAKEWLVR